MWTTKTDQTGQMPWLIWVFAGRTSHFVGFVLLQPWYFQIWGKMELSVLKWNGAINSMGTECSLEYFYRNSFISFSFNECLFLMHNMHHKLWITIVYHIRIFTGCVVRIESDIEQLSQVTEFNISYWTTMLDSFSCIAFLQLFYLSLNIHYFIDYMLKYLHLQSSNVRFGFYLKCFCGNDWWNWCPNIKKTSWRHSRESSYTPCTSQLHWHSHWVCKNHLSCTILHA